MRGSPKSERTSKMEPREAVKPWTQNRSTLLLVGGAAAAVAVALGVGYKYLRKSETHVRVGVVSQLLVHPLKSGKAASVPFADRCHPPWADG
uniref:Uncharacterized protein n=1 Tax=Hippocampus comes TaxID=109280 RepID=A0A3Q2YUD6_HIPCM